MANIKGYSKLAPLKEKHIYRIIYQDIVEETRAVVSLKLRTSGRILTHRHPVATFITMWAIARNTTAAVARTKAGLLGNIH